MKNLLNKNFLFLLTIVLLSGVFTRANADLNASGGFDSPFLVSDNIQNISDYHSALVNPALLFRVNQIRAEAGIYRWNSAFLVGELFDELGYQQASLLFPVRLRHTAGFTLITSGADFSETDINLNASGVTGSYSSFWLIPHYSFKALPWLAVGLNPKIVLQNHFGEIHAGWGLDVGFYGTVFDHYRLGDLGVSLNFQDVKPAVIKTERSDGTEAENVMTTRFRGGLRYSGLNDRLVTDVEVVIENFLGSAWSFLSDAAEGNAEEAAAEFGERVGRVSFHAKYQLIPQFWIKAGWNNNNNPYLGFNLNVLFLLPEMINKVDVEYQIGYSFLESERGPTSMAKIGCDFGPTREQRESKRLYDKLVLAPMTAYNEAMRLYVAGKYWEASYAFGKVLVLYPNFHLSDKATYYMGDCYSELRLNRIARQVFKDALAEFTTSDVRAEFLYGLEKLDFREGRYKDALKNHAFITNLYENSEIRSDADYIAGQIHYLKGNISAATSLLSSVDVYSPSYPYANYTLATINVQNNNIAAAIENLRIITEDTTSLEGEILLRSAAYTKLGQIYFEQVDMRNAVESFKQVDMGTRYGAEALLGIAWAWIKVNRPQECHMAINGMIANYPKSPLIPEAYLLKGYALMLMEDYASAKDSFLKAQKECRREYATEDDLIFIEGKYNEQVDDFDPTGLEIRKNALRKPTEKILQERQDLKGKFDIFDKRSREFFEYTLTVEDNKKFFRRRDEILADLDYALAKVTKMLEVQSEKDILEQQQKKQLKIDEKMKELEKQLEKLE